MRRSQTDGLGRLIRVDEPDAGGNLGSSSSPLQPTSYLYDAPGNLIQVNQGSQQRLFTYDTLSRLKTARNPEQVNSSSVMVATQYTYDDASNLITRTNPNGTQVSFTYDGLNRVVTKTLTTGTWTYSYDSGTNRKGRMVSVTKGTEGYFYDGYDAMGRLTQSRQVTNAGGADQTYTLTYGYDLAGNMTREEYPSGRVITTVFDEATRLNEVKGQKAGESLKTYASQYQYTPHGGVSQMMMSNGVMRETMLYNSRLQPEKIELRKTADNSLLLGLDYTYGVTNNNGNVQTQTIRFLHQGGTTTFNQSYTYDSLNRLETATESGSWSQTYAYDRWGNRRVSVSSGYAINTDLTPTQASHVSTATNRVALSGFSYDTSGNQTAQTRGVQSETLNYDSENRMTSFASGSTTTNYVYDGDGRRVKKVVGGVTTVFVYNAGGQLIAEYTTGQPQSGGTSYLTTDHLGSTRLVTDASGSVKARHDYLPFGEELSAGIGGRTTGMKYDAFDSTRQRFTSKERDTESGLDYFLARYYSSAQGRFTSADALLVGQHRVDPQSWNLFLYARNNPLLYVDPTGEDYIVFDKDGNEKRITDAELGDYELVTGNGGTAIFRDSNGVEWSGTFVDAPVDNPYNVQGSPLTTAEAVSLDEEFGTNLNWIIENIDENATVPDETQSILSRLVFGQRRIPYNQVITTDYVQWVTFQATMNGGGCGMTVGKGGPPLRPIHSSLQNTVLEFWRKKSTEEIIESLKPGASEALRAKPDGRIFNGHHRLKVLEERGVDINSLPREIIP